jgi:hypothetical protein
MKRLVLFAVVGSGIGAGAALARSDSTTEDSAAQPDLKTAAMTGAAAGGFVGFVLDRRAKRKTRKTKLVGYAQKARPKVEAALDAAFAAAEIALPKVEAAAEVARERAKERAVEASSIARDKAAEASTAARERAAEAAIHAKHAAAERADMAKRKAKKRGHTKAAKALDLLPV